MTNISSGTPLVIGLGAVCSLGANIHEIWPRLCEGQLGIRPITGFSREGLRTELAGWIEVGDIVQSTSRLEHFLVAALEEALANAKLDANACKEKRIGLVFGTSLGMSLVDPNLLPAPLDVMAGDGHNADLTMLADRLRLRFPFMSDIRVISNACSSGTHAIGLAADMLKYEGFDVVVAGGADVVDRLKYLGHTALGTLTTSLPCPYSRERSGTLFGEGAAFVVLQPDDVAGRADAYARCSGSGYSTDVQYLTAPDETGAGASVAVRNALREAGVAPIEIDHINLHGSGTALNDSAEFAALQSVFGERISAIPSTSVKAAVGHLMGAAGALEAVVTILSLHRATVPPTAQTQAEDLAFPIDLVVGKPRALPNARHALSLSLGFGGTNGALIFSAVNAA